MENHRTMVCLQATEDEMVSVMDRFWHSGDERYGTFVDEDLGDFFTAVAFHPMSEEEGKKWFSGFRLA